MKMIVGTDLLYVSRQIQGSQGDDAFIAELDRLRVGIFCKMSRWRTPDDIVASFDDGDVVEIYGLDFVQLYCNGKFFQVSSISPEDQTSRRFDELYLRPKHINESIANAVQRMIEADGKKVLMQVPEHTLKESVGEKRTIKVNFKYGAVLKDIAGNNKGFIVTQTAKWVASPLLTIAPVKDQAAIDSPDI